MVISKCAVMREAQRSTGAGGASPSSPSHGGVLKKSIRPISVVAVPTVRVDGTSTVMRHALYRSRHAVTCPNDYAPSVLSIVTTIVFSTSEQSFLMIVIGFLDVVCQLLQRVGIHDEVSIFIRADFASWNIAHLVSPRLDCDNHCKPA